MRCRTWLNLSCLALTIHVGVGFALSFVRQRVALPTGETPVSLEPGFPPPTVDRRAPSPQTTASEAAVSPGRQHLVVHRLPLAAVGVGTLTPVVQNHAAGFDADADLPRDLAVAGPLPSGPPVRRQQPGPVGSCARPAVACRWYSARRRVLHCRSPRIRRILLGFTGFTRQVEQALLRHCAADGPPTRAVAELSVGACKHLTDSGADHRFESLGNATAMSQRLACCHKAWGRSIVIGVAEAGSEIHVSAVLNRWQWNATSLGAVIGSACHGRWMTRSNEHARESPSFWGLDGARRLRDPVGCRQCWP
jgi:hypothetical protein